MTTADVTNIGTWLFSLAENPCNTEAVFASCQIKNKTYNFKQNIRAYPLQKYANLGASIQANAVALKAKELVAMLTYLVSAARSEESRRQIYIYPLVSVGDVTTPDTA